MYTHPSFKADRATGLAIAEQRGFGLIVGCDNGRPFGSHVPFHLVQAEGHRPRAEFHVARANPLAALAESGGTWLLAVQGNDAYVSADWYASQDQVPTWLYGTVHLSGPVGLLEGARKEAHLERISAKFENWLAPKPAWTPRVLSPARRRTLLNAITAIELVIDTVECSLKLNQHKTDADHVAVVGALARQQDQAARAIAQRMIAQRPQLDYD